jgi:ribosomal protein S18 acetylase RimI-like enzyme
MPSPHDIIEESIKRLSEDPLFAYLDARAIDRLRQLFGEAIASENEACMVTLWNATEGKERDAMVRRFAEIDHLANRSDDGSQRSCNLNTPYWTRWYPGLETDQFTVAEVLDTMPGLASEDIPAIIRAFESPTSPLKLPGASTLEHDVLHVLLGRGLVDQDEAFVLGFAAVSDPAFSANDIEKYKLAFSLYPEPFCIRGCDLIAFELGVQAARNMNIPDLTQFNPAEVRLLKVDAARQRLGIDKAMLYEIYADEQKQIPNTPWSTRLPTLNRD